MNCKFISGLALSTLWISIGNGVCVAAEPTPAAAPDSTPEVATQSSTVAVEPKFYIRAFEIHDNTILTAAEIDLAVYDYTGPDRVASDVERARAALQSVYEKRGYPTVMVSIPEQSVSSGIIRLDVVEQRIASVEVAGVRASKQKKILAQAPSLRVGDTPNFSRLQQDMVALNAKRDRRITPEIVPGELPNTIDARLNVDQSLPLHGTVEFNNRGSASTSKQRLLAQLRYDDMWGRGDSLSASYQTAPQRKEDGLVYSASYLARVGSQSQWLTYAVKSDTDIATVGGMRIVGRGNVAGTRYIHPLRAAGSAHQSITLGLDYKHFSDNLSGLGIDDPNTTQIETDQPSIRYWPLSFGWRMDVIDEKVDADVTLGAVWGVRGLGDSVEQFDAKRYGARPNFFALQLQGSRTDTYARNFQTYIGFDSQFAGRAVISNQQFSIGGMDSVRGYSEGQALGDNGAAIQLEARTPSFGAAISRWFDELRVHAFVDAGVVRSYQLLPGQISRQVLASGGLGLRLQAFSKLHIDVEGGYPFKSESSPDQPDERSVHAQFRVWGEF